MCTVTLIPTAKSGFILTSSRDEAPNRESIPPARYNYNDVAMVYPADLQSDGTWFGVSNLRAICLLNGEFKPHIRKLPYRLSRGILVKDLLALPDISAFATYNYQGIEPFTLVVVDFSELTPYFEYVWDGLQLHTKKLPSKPHIWSSSPLYNEAMKAERKQWFSDFLISEKDKINTDSIKKFHQTAGHGNARFGVVMNRGNVQTTSLTQLIKTGRQIEMFYKSIKNKTQPELTLPINFE